MIPDEPPHVPVIPPPRFFFGVSLSAAIAFVIWTWLVFQGNVVPDFDLTCATFFHDYSNANQAPWRFMVFLTDLGGIAAATLLAVMGSIWQTAIRHRTLAVGWLVIVIGGAIFNQGFKEVFNQKRPDETLRDVAVLERNNSYPSGHSMGSAIGFGLLGYALILPQRRRPRRIVALLFMAIIILAIGFSRMYLRAHWFSDVVGGIIFGAAWLFLCLGWLERQRLRIAQAS